MIGVSASPLRASYFVARYFVLRGISVIPINPNYEGKKLWGEKVLGKISDIDPNKRVDLLIRAFNKLNLPLIVIGDGPERSKLEKMANSNIKFLKQVSNMEVENYLSRCRAFVYSGLEDFAYVDKAYPIGADQTISQPYTVGFQTQLLELEKGDKVLEIGTGSGYQTAVLLLSLIHISEPTRPY